jgi:hypothetical protein
MRNAGSLWLSHATLLRSTPLNAGCKGGSPAKKRGFPKGGGKPAFEKSIKEKIFIDLFLCVAQQL